MRIETEYTKKKTKAINDFNELLLEHDIEESYEGQILDLMDLAENVYLPYTMVQNSYLKVHRDKKKGWKIVLDV